MEATIHWRHRSVVPGTPLVLVLGLALVQLTSRTQHRIDICSPWDTSSSSSVRPLKPRIAMTVANCGVAFHDSRWSDSVCERYILYPELLKIFASATIGGTWPPQRYVLTA